MKPHALISQYFRFIPLTRSFIVYSLFAGGLLNAAVVTWDGEGGDGKWGTGTNWDTNSAPGVSDTAVLGAGASSVAVASSAAVGTVNFGAAATSANTLTLSSNLRVAFGITVDAGSAYDHVISSGRTLNIGNSSSSLTGTQTVTFTNNSAHLLTLTDTSGTNNIGNGAIHMGATGTGGATMTLEFAGNGSFAVGQKVTQAVSTNSSVYNVSKSGAGTLTLSSIYNSYNGTTTVSAGKLFVDGTHTGGAAYDITNAQLGGSGTITTAGNAGVTIGAGGQLAAGAENSVGTFTMNLGTGALDMSGALAGDSGSLFFQLGAVGASDKIALGAGTTLNIGTDVLNFGDFVFSTEAGFGEGVYTLFESSTSIAGTLLSGQLSGTIGGLNAALSLSGDSQSVLLTVTAIPESANAALLFGGACIACVVGVRRRRFAANA
jgi:autotransporter-associated beta strand protein